MFLRSTERRSSRRVDSPLVSTSGVKKGTRRIRKTEELVYLSSPSPEKTSKVGTISELDELTPKFQQRKTRKNKCESSKRRMSSPHANGAKVKTPFPAKSIRADSPIAVSSVGNVKRQKNRKIEEDEVFSSSLPEKMTELDEQMPKIQQKKNVSQIAETRPPKQRLLSDKVKISFPAESDADVNLKSTGRADSPFVSSSGVNKTGFSSFGKTSNVNMIPEVTIDDILNITQSELPKETILSPVNKTGFSSFRKTSNVDMIAEVRIDDILNITQTKPSKETILSPKTDNIKMGPLTHKEERKSKNAIPDEKENVCMEQVDQKRKIVKAKRLLKHKPEDDNEVKITSPSNKSNFSLLPSPILPSNESENKCQTSEHLKFNSSKEEVLPSTSGSSFKRRTYELEDSTIELSLLKTVSSRDSKRMSSFPSETDSTETCTPTLTSKVTTRKKWVKRDSSAHVDSPKWLNMFAKNKKETVVKNLATPTPDVPSAAKKKTLTSNKISRIPNFAAIHQRAQDKLESLSEYKKRKDERAMMLLSGRKPETPKKVAKSSTTKKQLRFASNTQPKDKSPTFIPLPSTPLPKYIPHDESLEFITETQQPDDSITVSVRKGKERIQMLSEKMREETRQLQKNLGVESLFKIQMLTQQILAEKDRGVFKRINIKTEVQNNGNKLNIQIGKTINGNKDVIARQNAIKSIVTKGKATGPTVEGRRCQIKGVRSNRRFELLMKMRNGK